LTPCVLRNSLEEVILGLGVVAKEGDCVREHPNVAAAAVVVGFAPAAVLVGHGQNFVWLPRRVGGLVVRVGVVA